MSWLPDIVPYFLAASVLALGILSYLSDLKDHKNPWLRKAVVGSYVCVGILTGASIYLDSAEKRITGDRNAEEKRIAGERFAALQKNFDSVTKAQADTVEFFLKSLSGLNKELSDLKTKVATGPLQQKITTLEGELQKTQRALAPGPKAVLAFSFVPFSNPPPPGKVVPASTVSLPVLPDGSVHVEFTVLNMTDVPATDVTITVILCDACKFAKEPPGSKRLPNHTERQRLWEFKLLTGRTALETRSVDILVSGNASFFVVGVDYRCGNCVVPEKASVGQVNILR